MNQRLESIPEQYFAAGRIAAEVREEIRRSSLVGKTFLEICSSVEELIRSKGGELAFPCNICLNEIAAHYTAGIDDEGGVNEGDVVKVDIGVHIDGYIADTAITTSFNSKYDELVRAVEYALNEAVKKVRGGIPVGDIGSAISNTAAKLGFKPITNLSGHMVEQYTIHAGISIPNVWTPMTSKLRINKVYAVEPFLTTLRGAGSVVETPVKNIFSLVARRKTKNKKLDEFVDLVWSRYRTLPFAARYFLDVLDKKDLKPMLDKLVLLKVLRAYPVLVEANGSCVAQAEHTVVPTSSGALVLTQKV